MGFAMDMATGQAPRRTRTGRDNSVLLSRNNLLPPAFWTKRDLLGPAFEFMKMT